MSTDVLTQASSQWSTRPADQRFNSLDAIQKQVHYWRSLAREAKDVQFNSLRAEASGDDVLVIGKANLPSKMTHWAFGQLAKKVGAPAGYLRTLAPALAANNLNYGLKRLEDGDKGDFIFEVNGEKVLRAATTDTYTRIWNSDVVDGVVNLVERNPEWQPAPAAFDGSRGLYASDQDMFMFMVDNNRKIFEKQEGGLSRGFFVKNSEVGAASFEITTFFYEWVCGNHRVWGASGVRELRIPHVGKADQRAFAHLSRELAAYAGESATEDEAKIERAHRFEIAPDREGVIDAIYTMTKLPVLTRKLIGEGFDRAEQKASVYGAPNTAWGFTGGLTEIGRDQANASQRVAIDRAAGKILQMAF
jgi:hypothetical protein